ncbi:MULTISPECIES: hypothetical protein [unclassified Crossiella]|uniref:hypothetical protein n=1 Tax=unclassified Crossiella TaxID=2620835 RepID=UPI001FFF5C72|nr:MULTISPECIES: hypothetical protein [unclassified Crossiella]MCK2241654.1 hypothetical protein [Crossiella sp. S99.2]MCK2255474.1 hypothetical protein [Crossiella sp. S99.1]
MDPNRPPVGLILDFANCKLGRQASLVREQHKMLTDPDRQPWNFYGPMITAMKSFASDVTRTEVLDSAVRKVRGTTKARHYMALREGFVTAWNSGYANVPVGAAVFRGKTIGMTVNPQLAYKTAADDLAVVYLYLKEEQLTKDAAQPILFAMNEVMGDLLPGARPRILDIRRTRFHQIDKRLSVASQGLQVAGILGQWAAMWADFE